MHCHVKSLVYYEHQPQDYVLLHKHTTFECVFYQEGSGVLGAGGEILPYQAPCFAITRPGVRHDESTKEFSKVWITLFLCDQPELLPDVPLASLSAEQAKHLQETYEKMVIEQREDRPFRRETMDVLFEEILFDVLRGCAARGKREDSALIIKKAKNYIRENFKLDIDFAFIAKTFGYSYDRFRHIFKDETGVSVEQYLLNQRLDEAKRLLTETDLPIFQVAADCGFASPIYFNNFFKSRLHISPLVFRQSTRKDNSIGVVKVYSEIEEKQ
jgi:AraC-like DNA-binding protein